MAINGNQGDVAYLMREAIRGARVLVIGRLIKPRIAIRRHQRGLRTRNWTAHQAMGRTAAPARTIRSTRRAPRGTTRSRRVERARCGRAARSRALRTSSLMREVIRKVIREVIREVIRSASNEFPATTTRRRGTQKVLIIGNQRQSEAIRGNHQRSSEAHL